MKLRKSQLRCPDEELAVGADPDVVTGLAGRAEDDLGRPRRARRRGPQNHAPVEIEGQLAMRVTGGHAVHIVEQEPRILRGEVQCAFGVLLRRNRHVHIWKPAFLSL